MSNTRIQLYIATSLDGYIARPDGSLDWLDAVDHPENEDYGYGAFYGGISTVIMGRKTYEEVMSFGVEWPYGNCQTLIATSDRSFRAQTESTGPVHKLDRAAILQLKEEAD